MSYGGKGKLEKEAKLLMPLNQFQGLRNVAKDNKKNRINPRHILFTIRNDEDDKFNLLMCNITIVDGGVVVPTIKLPYCPTEKRRCRMRSC
jgi:hypothetical protein